LLIAVKKYGTDMMQRVYNVSQMMHDTEYMLIWSRVCS